MPRFEIKLSSLIHDSFRVRQVAGMFDLPMEARRETVVSAQAPGEDESWDIGVIVGPSGSGKSTVAAHAFADALYHPAPWPADRAVIDCLGDLPIKRIVRVLTAVGFSSPRSWLVPHRVLSTGEQFRCELARALLQDRPLVVFDEFTSVVDRAVAKIASAAIARAIRRGAIPVRFIAVTCHYDVVRWLEPDWVLDMGDAVVGQTFLSAMVTESGASPRLARGRAAPASPKMADRNVSPTQADRNVRPTRGRLHWGRLRRPPIHLAIRRAASSQWTLFRDHHYLSGRLHPGSLCFIGSIDARPATFIAALPFPHPRRPGWREHRAVCLPDFQGVGIGSAMSDFVAGLFAATGKPYFSRTSHPAMIHHRTGSALWKMLRNPGMVSRSGRASARTTGMSATTSRGRNTAGFEYVGPARVEDARRFGIA